MSEENQIGREDCYICGRGNPDVLERHHIVPRRYSGSDDPVNLVDLCPTCHRALETLYNERFYRVLGVGEHDEIIQYAAGDIADRLDQLELNVSMELRKFRDQIENEYITEFDEEKIRQAMREHAVENREVDDSDSLDEKQRVKLVREVIEELEKTRDDGVPIDLAVNESIEAGLDQNTVERIFRKLRRQGDLYEPVSGNVRVV